MSEGTSVSVDSALFDGAVARSVDFTLHPVSYQEETDMLARVIYESMFGNTAAIAAAIAQGLSE
ncbi:hypothetical protein ACIBG0_36210 [Nocardia sp. NPDC050630]|uniref:hypothetical protein n=1 Tax=Nocardia sp. NPDC050630 TaxID=3364321 RepID=UPI0037A14B1C